MDIRQLARGTVPWDRLERVATILARRYDRDAVRVEFLAADNWLSIPCIVDDEWFVKIVTKQHTRVHALLTAGRNAGALSSGSGGFFTRFETPLAMVEHEYEATQRMREIGCNAPEPIEAFEANGLGVLVLEYLPAFESVDDLDATRVRALAPELFATLATMHDNGLAHGDLRAENLLVADGDLYFIDATKVLPDRQAAARAYDLACALAILEPRVGVRSAVAAASEQYAAEDLLDARDFLDFVRLRPDHRFDSTRLRSELEKWAALSEG
ncbi:RIO1 family regulatory kinase/ATPase [Halovivax limisalsi]|uniref:RIO1 family regulatory kinase/ATPase domain-containing protein n=1 Tax=Halovivax limisalsi TaxID=1453760 RepID=UPI001FFDC3A3|nr:RIO1 family regulatory kinase/ATPase [Halovivax limisalsi]